MDATLYYPSPDLLMTNGPTIAASDGAASPPPPPTHADLYKELRKAVNVNFAGIKPANLSGALGPASSNGTGLIALPLEPPAAPPRTMAELAEFIRDRWDQVVSEEMEEIAGGTDETEVVAAPLIPAIDDRFDHADYPDALVGHQYPSYEVSSSTDTSPFPTFSSNYAIPEHLADGDEASVYFDAEDSLPHYDTVVPNTNRLFALLGRRSRMASPATLPEDEKPDTTQYVPSDRVLRSSSSFTSSSTSLSSSASLSPSSHRNSLSSDGPSPTFVIKSPPPTLPSPPRPQANLKSSSNELVPSFFNATVNKLTQCGMSSMYTQNMDVALPGRLPTARAPTRSRMAYAEALPKPVFPLFCPASPPSAWAVTDVLESPSLTMSTPNAVSNFEPIPGLPYGRVTYCDGPHWASPVGLAYAQAASHPDCSCHRSIQSHISHWDTYHYQCGLESYMPCNVRGRQFPDFRSSDLALRFRGVAEDGRLMWSR